VKFILTSLVFQGLRKIKSFIFVAEIVPNIELLRADFSAGVF
jgi:hypothetical protein